MKTLLFILLIVFALSSCKKDEEKTPEIPKWLSDKIQQMDTVGYYKGSVVTLYKWSNEYYYLLNIPLSSCIMCDFYDYQGQKIIWTAEKTDDFQQNAIKVKDIWSDNY